MKLLGNNKKKKQYREKKRLTTFKVELPSNKYMYIFNRSKF